MHDSKIDDYILSCTINQLFWEETKSFGHMGIRSLQETHSNLVWGTKKKKMTQTGQVYEE